MGYRSDVAIALGFHSKDDCDAFIVAYKLKEPEFWKDTVSPYWLRPDSRVLTGYYEQVKWVTLYDDVSQILEMLTWAEDVYEANHRVVKIGEDYDDIEIEESSDNVIENLSLELYVDVGRCVDYDNYAQPIDESGIEEESDSFMEDPYVDEHMHVQQCVCYDNQGERVDSK